MDEFYYVLYRYLKDVNVYTQFESFIQNKINDLNENLSEKKLIELIYNKIVGISNSNSDDKIYKLKSILGAVNFKDSGNDIKRNTEPIYRNFNIEELSSDYIYPVKDSEIEKQKFILHMNFFINEIKKCKINDKEQEYYLFKKYFSCVPVQNSPDCYISLFVASKIISAIYSCLKNENINSNSDLNNQEFSLVKADVSGIQEFIFSITSKEAAKSLKGRSVYINLLTDIISKYIVRKLNLTKNNILYNGGGNFYILIPKSKIKEIIDIRKYISKVLLNAHKGKIYIAIGVIEDSDNKKLIKIEDLKNISKYFKEVTESTQRLKNKKWSDIGIEENFKSIFGPIDSGNAGKKLCSICASELNDNDKEMCDMCKSFSDLTNQIKNAKFYCEREVEIPDNICISDYKSIFKSFGYDIKFSSEKDKLFKNYLINDTRFIGTDCEGYIFKAFNLPKESVFEKLVSYNQDNSSDEVLGDKKLGVLKLDVDNLGKVFMKGLNLYANDNVPLGAVIELSNSIALFFEGYLNQLIAEDNDKKVLLDKEIRGHNWNEVMYTIYAGGDDTFILGAYNEVFEFAYILRKSFQKYVCNNEAITFSAGLGLFPYKYPVIKCAQYTEQFLDDAKTYIRNSQKLPQKNSVSLFGEVFRWNEFEKILKIRNLCIDIYQESNNRAFLQKILNSTKGFKSIMSDIDKKDKIRIAKVYRLAYYLRELKNKNYKLKDYVEQLIKEYEDMVVQSILNKTKDSYNIMVIPAAVRWAELNTKKVEERDE